MHKPNTHLLATHLHQSTGYIENTNEQTSTHAAAFAGRGGAQRARARLTMPPNENNKKHGHNNKGTTISSNNSSSSTTWARMYTGKDVGGAEQEPEILPSVPD